MMLNLNIQLLVFGTLLAACILGCQGRGKVVVAKRLVSNGSSDTLVLKQLETTLGSTSKGYDFHSLVWTDGEGNEKLVVSKSEFPDGYDSVSDIVRFDSESGVAVLRVGREVSTASSGVVVYSLRKFDLRNCIDLGLIDENENSTIQ